MWVPRELEKIAPGTPIRSVYNIEEAVQDADVIIMLRVQTERQDEPSISANDYIHGYQSYVCLFQPEEPNLANCERLFDTRNQIMGDLEEKGIITRQGTHAPPHLHYYAEKYRIRPADFPNAFLAERLSLTLPLFAGMTEGETETVANELVAQFARRYVPSQSRIFVPNVAS